MSIETLDKEPQKPIAVMIACWQEQEVILKMLTGCQQSFQYQNYHVFIGVYPNDPQTKEQVNLACQRFSHFHLVELDHNGPTTKSDNINSVWRAIKEFETATAILFQIFVIHDAEDHVPEYGLSIFNHLIPRKDVVQLPVLPLKTPWHQWTAGTYMDEFATMHLVSLRVREWLSGHIPTAGVGCGFSRRFLDFASQKNENRGPLAYDTLTEDYELPLIHRLAEDKEAFYDSIVRGKENQTHGFVSYIPAVRSYFPSSLRRAIVQKSRWILGISLQGTEHLGWRGSFSEKYMLFRDRKGLVTNLVTFFALILMLIVLIDSGIRGPSTFLNFLDDQALFRLMIWFNVVLMFILIFTRAICTALVYGPIHGILSFPRIYLGNLINGLATIRAIRIYRASKRSGQRPRWDKTQHEI